MYFDEVIRKINASLLKGHRIHFLNTIAFLFIVGVLFFSFPFTHTNTSNHSQAKRSNKNGAVWVYIYDDRADFTFFLH